MKLDILAIGVHPDDVELGCGGTLMKQIDAGYTAGILDLTQGELGTRGTVNDRKKEAAAAAKILGVKLRGNLSFADGFFKNDKEHQLELVKMIRKYQPSVVISNAKYDRHPDHARAAGLTRDACFLAGLSKVDTKLGGVNQKAWRPKAVYHYIQAIHQEPHFVVDVTKYFDRKLKAVLAFKSQFYDAKSNEPDTFISSPEFLEFVKARAVHYGVPVGVKYAEAYTVNRFIGVNDIVELF